MTKFKKQLENLRHETPEKIHTIQENHQEFEKKCEPLQATKIFSRVYLKATKFFEPTRLHVTWYFEGSELASAICFAIFFKNFLFTVMFSCQIPNDYVVQ